MKELEGDEVIVSFLNVGQGDSIVLRWIRDEEEKIAILDCKRNNRLIRRFPTKPSRIISKEFDAIPTINFLKELPEPCRRIEFICISHPHADHCSGMIPLLNYCEEENIDIGVVYHSLSYTQFFHDILKESDRLGSTNGERILKKLKHLQQTVPASAVPIWTPIFLNSKVILEFWSPSDQQIKTFLERNPKAIKEGTSHSDSKSMNYLSTLALVRGEKDGLLLSSDCPMEVLEQVLALDRLKAIKEQSKKLINAFVQVPHHGSSDNHTNEYYQLFDQATAKTAVISAGKHGTYKHPHLSVVQYLDENEFDIKSTSWRYGLIEHFGEKKPVEKDIEIVIN